MIDPCVNEPKDFLALDKKNPYRFKGIDGEQIGKNTILAIGINDIERLMAPRMSEWEDIHQRLEDLFDNLQEQGIKGKYKKQLETLMEKCTKESSYAAVKATNMLNDDTYFLIKNFFKVNNAWTSKYETIELEMKEGAMRLV